MIISVLWWISVFCNHFLVFVHLWWDVLIVELNKNVIIGNKDDLSNHLLFLHSNKMYFSCAWWRFYEEAKLFLVSFLTDCNHASCLLESLYCAIFVDFMLWRVAYIALFIPEIGFITFGKVGVINVDSVNDATKCHWVCWDENTTPVFISQMI